MGRGGRKGQLVAKNSLVSSLPEGASLYLVGGAIRDQLLGRPSGDEDLALGGLSQGAAREWLGGQGMIESLEVAGEDIGWRLRTTDGPSGGVEVALLRREKSSGPEHRDFQIDTRGVTIEEDLRRRDFSCNAIARDLRSGEIIDPFGGQEDIASGTLRALGEHVFREDPLRLLRGAVRVGRDGLWPEEETMGWMRQARTEHLPPERIWKELSKIISSPDPYKALDLLRQTSQYEKIFPELSETLGWGQESQYHAFDCDEHCLRALQYAADKNYSPVVRWAALLHDSGKPASAWRGEDGNLHYYQNQEAGKRDHAIEGSDIARDLLQRLRAPRNMEEDVCYLVEHHMWQDLRGWSGRGKEDRARRARRFLHRHGRHTWDLVNLRRADAASKGRDASDELKQLDDFEKTLRQEDTVRWRLEDLEISGHDLLEIGLRGSEVGEALEEIQQRIIDNPGLNERQRLLRWAQKIATRAR